MGHSLITLILLSCLFTVPGTAFAQTLDRSPLIQQKHILPDAVRIQVTPRGMQYFDKKLSYILGNLGVKLDEGYFPAMSYSFDKEINPEDYAASHPEAVQIYKQVRDLLTNWLVGFSLKNHRPHLEIGESGYTAQFSRFSLLTDQELMDSLGYKDGAVLAIELDVEKINIATHSVRAWDLNNPFLGQVGFEDFSIQGGGEKPLKLRLPFYLRMNSSGGLDFQALEIRHNIADFPLALKYKKLLVPHLSVEINGQKFTLNTSELERTLDRNMPTVFAQVRAGLSDFITHQLPDLLNQKANEFFAGSLEQVQDMIPPGKEPGDLRPDFKWGLQLSGIHLKNSLNINLNAYVEDALNPASSPLGRNASRGAPTMGHLHPNQYDLSLALDRSLVNRILQLSFQRKNFENIKQSDGTKMRLMAAPTVDYIEAPRHLPLGAKESFLKLRVSVENHPSSLFLKDTIVVDFDILAKLRQVPGQEGMQLVLMSINADSLYLDAKYFSLAGRLIKNRVLEGVKDELRAISRQWENKEEVLEGSFPLPPEIMGIKLDIEKVLMDPQGHLLMYLNYATGVKK